LRLTPLRVSWSRAEDPVGNKNRYLQIEVFDYNYGSWIEATWT